MQIDILTLFPEMFTGPFDQSIIKHAQAKGLVTIKIHDLRKWAIDDRGTVDDRPYGGGVGMVLRVEPIFNALKEIKQEASNSKTILMDARGDRYSQQKAKSFSQIDQLIIICGHYEGVDERVVKNLIDEAISIGPYVLTGGEIPAMVITDSVTRLVSGVLKPDATKLESFSANDDLEYLEHPQYTRPEEFNGWRVPDVLLSGNHKEISKWRGSIKNKD